MRSARVLLLALALGAAPMLAAPNAGRAAAATPAVPAPCTPNGKLKFICGLNAVEDLVATPGGRWIFGSSMQAGSAGLYLIDPRTKTAKPASISLSTDAAANTPYAGCKAPDLKALTTHGLDVRPGKGGHHTLYAINHAGRESIEVFDVDTTGPEPRVAWIGCMLAPEGVSANAIVALPDGRLAVSKYQPLGDNTAIGRMLNGEVTGSVYIWKAGAGFSELPGVRLSGDNGLVVSPDGKWLYIAVWGGKSVMRVSLDGSGPPKTTPLEFRPDNLRWSADRKSILAAGQYLDASNRAGPHGWGVVSLDPQTLAATPMLHQPGVPGFDDATTALQVGKDTWFGTFRGDRIAYITGE
jgi:hypothetical protein